jgi:hypothetical protein
MDPVDVTTFPETEGAPMRRLTGSPDPDGSEAVVRPAQAVPAADEHCAECGAPMASDQRYCVECGERRGERRFPAAMQPAATTSAASPPPAEGRRSRMSSSTTLIAGVGTLLLAMGVGVLIGRSDAPKSAAAPTQVISVAQPGGATTGAASTPASTPETTPAASEASAKGGSLSSKSSKKGASGAGSSNKGGGGGKNNASGTTPKSSSTTGGKSGKSYEEKSKNLPNVVSTG